MSDLRQMDSSADHVASEWIVQSTEKETLFYGKDRAKVDSPLKERIVKFLNASCSLHSWKEKLPILKWLPKYRLADLQGDIVAGITVGMTSVPQALAYAQIADLPLEYGLYSSFMCCFVYTVMGTSKDLTLGVTSVVSLLTAEAMPEDATVYERTKYAIFLAFLVGLCQLLMGTLRLGFLFNFISHPVLSGFTTASAFIIMFGQIKNILGIAGGSSTETVIQQGIRYIRNITRIKGWDILVGMLCISALLFLRRLKTPKKSKYGTIFAEIIRLIIAARYGVVVIFATLAGYLLTYFDIKVLSLTADVNSALPPLAFPDLNWSNITFVDHFRVISPTLPFVVLISSMETIAIAKAFGDKSSYIIDPTQELMAIGLSNFLTSFVSGYPITGSFTKSSLNAQSGVRTPLGCIFTGSFVLLSQLAISGAFRYVPKAALGAVIIVAVLVLFDFKLFKELWQTKRMELIPLVITVLFSLFFGLEVGFLVGIVTSLILVLFALTKPDLKLEVERTTYVAGDNPALTKKVINVRISPQGSIFFPAMENFRTYLNKKVFPCDHKVVKKRSLRNPFRKHKDFTDISGTKPLNGFTEELPTESVLIFHGADLQRLDFTTMTSLHSVIDQYQSLGHRLRFVDTPKRILELIVPKNLRNFSEEARPDDLISLEIPQQDSSRKQLVNIVVDLVVDTNSNEEFHQHGESQTERRLSSVTSNLE